jgi:hypothetical protein
MPVATNVYEVLYQYLSTVPLLTALVGDRIYPSMLPQQTTGLVLPALTYFDISGDDYVSQSGRSNLLRSRFQFTIWAYSQTDAFAVRAQLLAALSGAKALFNGYELGPCIPLNFHSFHDAQENLFQSMVDFAVWNNG